MKLIGNLKKQVEQSETKAEAREVIKNTGMLLTDEELEAVAGGLTSPDYEVAAPEPSPSPTPMKECPKSPTGQHLYIGGRRVSHCVYCKQDKPKNDSPLRAIGS